jgi:hypothetical protein
MGFTSDAAMARFGFALGWQTASEPKLIGRQKGGEFEAARLKSWAGRRELAECAKLCSGLGATCLLTSQNALALPSLGVRVRHNGQPELLRHSWLNLLAFCWL